MHELWCNFELGRIFLCTQLCVGLYFIMHRPNLVLYSICCVKASGKYWSESRTCKNATLNYQQEYILSLSWRRVLKTHFGALKTKNQPLLGPLIKRPTYSVICERNNLLI